MADTLTLLGALVATGNLNPIDADAIEAFCTFVDEIEAEVPDLSTAMDLALDFFNDDPDTAAAESAAMMTSAHDSDVCPDCGGDMMDEYDITQAFSLWSAVRDIADKYAFDRFHSHGEIEEC